MPYDKTVVYIIDRRHLKAGEDSVIARRMEINEACIHLLAEYDNPEDQITFYMLNTPATNTAELLRDGDQDLVLQTIGGGPRLNIVDIDPWR